MNPVNIRAARVYSRFVAGIVGQMIGKTTNSVAIRVR